MSSGFNWDNNAIIDVSIGIHLTVHTDDKLLLLNFVYISS